jgi:hypothetical protein
VTPVSSTNKTDCHDITEILLNVALNTIKRTNNNIKTMKRTFCTFNNQIFRKYTEFNPDGARLTFDDYILFNGQSSYNRMRFYICITPDDSIITGHLRNG